MVNFAMTGFFLTQCLQCVYNGVEHLMILCFHRDIVLFRKKTELFSKLLILKTMGPAFCIFIYLTFLHQPIKSSLKYALLVFPLI